MNKIKTEDLKMTPKILDEFKYLISPLSKEQKESLKENIKAYGLREPLIVWKEENVLVDGHNRYEICEEIGIEPKYVYYSFKDKFDVLSFIIENQIIRRNLQPFEKIEVYAKLKENLNEIGRSKKGIKDSKKHNTLLLIAEKTGYSHDTIHKAFYVGKNGSDELKSALREGKISINQAYSSLKKVSKGGLKKKFVFPPFSVLDSSSSDWVERKRDWFDIIGKATKTRDGEFGRISGETSKNSVLSHINSGTSVFDPVLCELLVRWFSSPSDKILDPFAGGPVRGAVCGSLSRKYFGVEIRQEQIDENLSAVNALNISNNVFYKCGDSQNIDNIFLNKEFNMCLTCPPYYNLEVYSESDLSAMGSYEDFIGGYSVALKKSADLLCDGSFFAIVVGDVRGRDGGYYGFIYDTFRILTSCGLKLYNEIIFKNVVGTAAMRASGNMKNRKITKIHQNVLVFYKGNTRKIRKMGEGLSDI